MGIQTFFRNLFPHRNTITRKPSTKRKLKPRIELLEDRTVPAFTATLSGTTVTFTESAITNGNDLLIFSDDGSGFLQHNRFDEGDVGFNSAVDLDSSIPGDQTIEVANLTELTVDAGNLADTVTLNVDLGTDTVDFGVAGTTDNGGVVNLNGTITNTVMGDAAIVNVGSTGSIQNGIDVVVENATVNVAAGNFDEVVTIATNGITLSGSGSDTTTVTTSIPADVITITADDVTVSNLQVTEGTNGISADSITNLTISGILSDLNDDHGLSVSSLTGMLMISSSVFQNNDNDSDIDGAGIHLDTVEIADISGSTSTGNEEALIASSLTTLTLSDNTFTVNNNDTAIDSLTTLNLNTTNGTVVDTVELNTPAIGGDGFLQHDRNGTIQDLVAYTLVTNLNIDVGDGNDSVTVNPHSTTLISLDGGEPTTFPGDVFSLDSTGTTGANLSVTNGNGIFSFTSGEANIQYTDFELIDSDNPYSLQINTGITDDDIQVTLVSGNLEVSRNGANIFRGDPSDISSLTINGEDGNDSLTVNVPTGIIPDLPEITYNGGSDTDSLFFLGGDNLNPITQETYLVGTNEDEGTWILDQDGNRGKGAAGAGNGDEIVVSFTGLEPADSDIPATNFDIIMNGSDNIATIENGGDLNGSTSLQLTDENATFETTRFANKVNVDIMGQSGEDAFVLDYTTNADGLLTLDIYGHVAPGTGFQPADDNAEDYFQPGATASGAIVGLFGQGGDDLFENMSLGFNMGISVPVGPFNLSSLNGEVSIDGGTAGETLGDNLALSDALSTGPDTVTITNNAISGAAPTTINYSNSDRVFFESTLADDILNIVGIDSISLELNLLDGDDSVTVNSTGGANVAELLVEGGAGTEDQITWDAGATTIGAVNFNEVELAFLDDDINTLSLDGNVTLITALDDQAMIQDGIDIAGGDAVGGSTFTLGDGVGSDLFQEENIEVNVNNLVIQGSGSLPENTEVTSNGMSNGFSIIANDITIENIRFRNNDNGIQATGVNNLSISNVETLDNDLDGINIVGSTLLPLVNIISTGNNGSGLCIDANDQPVTIQGGQYVDNDLDGIKITNAGDVTIATNVQANMNGRHGININDAGAVLVEINIQANNNGMLTVGDGIHVELLSGSITIRNGIQARTNSGSGICIDANDQPVTIQGGEYELNEIDGIKITNAGEVNINTNVQVNTNGRHGMNITDSNSVVIQNNIQVSGNGTMTPGDGVHIDTITGTTQFISGSDTFTVGVVITNNVDPTLNSLNGLNILNVPADTLIFNSIDSAGNSANGLAIQDTGSLLIKTSSFNNNGHHGINLSDAGTVLIEENIQANANGTITVGDGIHVELLSESITIRNGIQARTNSGSGICIDANDQPVTIQGGEYELNEIDGIKITNAGEVNINTNVQVNTNGRHGMNITDSNSVVIQNNIQVSGNGTMTPGDGVHIDTITGTTQFISGSDTFTVGVVITNNVDPTLNSLNGLNILNVPADTLIFNSIDSAGNSANGLAIQDTGNFLINTSTFNNNLEDGIHLVRPLSALLTEVLSIGNTDDGLEVQGDSSITTGGSTVTLGGSLDDNVNDPYVANMNDQGLNINNIGRLIMNRPSILNNTAGGLTPGGILNQIGRIDINGHGTATDINSDDSVSVNAGFLSMQFGSVKQDDFNLGTFDSVVINLGFFGEPSGPDSLFNPGTLFANTSSDFVHLTNGQALQIAAELGYLSKIFIPIGLTSDSTIAPSTSEVAKFLEEFVNSFVPETDLLANSEFILTNTLSDLADQYGFRPANSFFLNLFGYGEKWFQDRESNWFAITADGTIFEHTNFAGVLGKEIAKTSTSVYVNPNLLFDGAVLVDVLPRPTPILAAINDQTIRHSKPLDVTLFGAGGFSDELTYSAEIEGYDVLYEIDEAKQFRMNQAYYANSWNLNEKWIWSDTDATWFALLPDGKLYPYSNGLLGEMIADVGSDVWEDPTLLHEAPKPVAPVIDTIITDNNLTLDTVHIAPTTFRVNVSVSDGYSSATQSFLVTTTNSAPEFAEILANINTSHNSGPVSVDLQATDSDGDALTYNVEIREHNPLADWNERLDLVQVNGSYYYNSHGYNEKWLYSNAREQWFLLTDTGDLHPWVERYADEAVGSFGREVWVNPELLHEAVPSEILEGAAEVLGETVNIMPPEDFVGELEVTVIVSDSYASNQQKFLVNVTNEPPQILASLSTVTFSHSDFIQSIDLGVLDNDGDFLTYDVEIVEHNQAAILNQELQLKKVNGTYYENLYGMNEKWMQSTIDQLWYALLPNGKLYRSNGIYLEEQPVADLGIEYWVDPSLLHDASNSAPSHTIHGSIVDGILTLDWGEDDRGTFHITVNAYDGFETTTLRFLLIID